MLDKSTGDITYREDESGGHILVHQSFPLTQQEVLDLTNEIGA